MFATLHRVHEYTVLHGPSSQSIPTAVVGKDISADDWLLNRYMWHGRLFNEGPIIRAGANDLAGQRFDTVQVDLSSHHGQVWEEAFAPKCAGDWSHDSQARAKVSLLSRWPEVILSLWYWCVFSLHRSASNIILWSGAVGYKAIGVYRWILPIV